MGRQTGDQSQLFYLFNLEERVPASCIIPTIHHGGSRPMVNKSRLRLVTPANILPTVTPRRGPNTEYRTREHLTEAEVEALIKAAKANRWPHRDATMILLPFRHGLRVGELVNLKWEQVDLDGAVLHVNRLKSGTPSTQPLTGRELRALRRLRREAKAASPFVFVSERGAPFTADGFAKMLARAGEVAPPPHASACVWVRPGQQGHGHEDGAGLSRAPIDHEYGALHGAVARQVQGAVERLNAANCDAG
jgi:Phage integrase family